MLLFDTHTHFDVPDFDADRAQLAMLAKQNGVEALVLIGITAERFPDLLRIHHDLKQLKTAPQSYLAPGLHPIYIEQHLPEHLNNLAQLLQTETCVAIGEIGLDTFLQQHKPPEIYQKQREYFDLQLAMAKQYQKPVLLHIRKAHADVLQQLKQHKFQFGGIAHAFSGGVEEAKALIKMGFKIGITGQVTNPQAKKLHQVIQKIGAEHLVIETDCPDMTPLCCQISTEKRTRNTPVNLPFVLAGLAKSLNLSAEALAPILWQNSCQALHLAS
ncbi:TatD family hydrolase [Acinetobacter sp. MD2]|uniref:TatD family hydrolase n=1 Tax=Acinetobacter sp. MD2 TaxID=2600066 RepID=UPI002D1ED1E1|nr:TatD family hydrolase [Acinetobacter sp. MD2]MEB3767418.1 TatD family hydrolase [Acinetobacter sp. MD2]